MIFIVSAYHARRTAAEYSHEMWKAAIIVALAAFGMVEGCTYKEKECPDYTVVESHPDYEIRSYPALTWASTSETSRYRRIGQYTMRLIGYISGQNDREQMIPMTVPMRMQTTESGSQTIFDMSFFVPTEFSSNPPVPSNDKVKIVKEPPTQYAVRTFKVYAWRQSRWVEEAQKLARSVKDDATVINATYYQVGYDAPFDLLDQRNEIWMVKRGNDEALVSEASNEV